jgi:hypothetical protein
MCLSLTLNIEEHKKNERLLRKIGNLDRKSIFSTPKKDKTTRIHKYIGPEGTVKYGVK